jgi:hypothetical protein
MPRSPKPPEDNTVAAEFVTSHLGKGAFAPLTGTDWRAWKAFVHLLDLFGVSRDQRAVDAMRACYACTLRGGVREQVDVAEVFRQTIPAVLDWSDVRGLWPQIAPNSALEPRAININVAGYATRAVRG